MNRQNSCRLLSYAFLATFANFCFAEEPIKVEDFESGELRHWVMKGSAFGKRPQAHEDLSNCTHKGIYHNQVRRSFTGDFVLSSLQTAFTDHDPGSATSPPFKVAKRYLNMKLGGNSRKFLDQKSNPGSGFHVIIDGEKVLTYHYPHTVPFLRWYSFDLGDYAGKDARIEFFDKTFESFLLVDEISLDDAPKAADQEARTKSFEVTGPVVNIPVLANNGPMPTPPPKRVLKVFCDGDFIHEIVVPLATGKPDFFVPMFVDQWMGQRITVEVDQLDAGSHAIKDLACADTLQHDGDLYQEELRPLVHFTPSRGHINDPNGLVFYDGEYHLFYQADPFNMMNLNFYWGHAVSTDLVHWKELRPALRAGLEAEGFAWSGGAFVDWNNDGGWQVGSEKTVVATFWDYHLRKTSLAFSTDRGRTFTRYSGNPILQTKGSDPSRVWFHQPTQQWCLAVTDEENGRAGMRLFHSTDLKQWEKGSIAFFNNKERFYECPDFFEIPVSDIDGVPVEPRQTKWIMHDGAYYYAVCDFDGKRITIEEEPGKLCDPGHFYAAQKWSDIPAENGRTITIAWQRRLEVPQPYSMRSPITPEETQPFNGQLTFPVEMTLRQTDAGLRLFAKPIRELELLHVDAGRDLKSRKIDASQPLRASTKSKAMRAKLKLRVGTTGQMQFRFNGFHFVYDCEKEELIVLGQTRKLKAHKGVIHVEAILDVTSVVLFFNDGRIYIPINHIAKTEQRGIEISVIKTDAELLVGRINGLRSSWSSSAN